MRASCLRLTAHEITLVGRRKRQRSSQPQLTEETSQPCVRKVHSSEVLFILPAAVKQSCNNEQDDFSQSVSAQKFEIPLLDASLTAHAFATSEYYNGAIP